MISQDDDAKRPFEELIVLIAGMGGGGLGLGADFLASWWDEPAGRIADALAAIRLIGCAAGYGAEEGCARFAAWPPGHEPGGDSDDPGRPYLPGGAYTVVRKQDLACVLAALRNLATGSGVPDPELRQVARLREALMRLNAAAGD
jgi:hypothetical protein